MALSTILHFLWCQLPPLCWKYNVVSINIGTIAVEAEVEVDEVLPDDAQEEDEGDQHTVAVLERVLHLVTLSVGQRNEIKIARK